MLKIRWLKYRIFALFRRAYCYGAPGEKPRALVRGVAGLLGMKKA